MTGHENEALIRRELSPHLADGEKLLAAVGGNLAPIQSSWPGKPVFGYVGLTSERMIVLPVKDGRPDRSVASIERRQIQKLSLKSRNRSNAQITVELPGDKLLISLTGGGVVKWADSWVAAHTKHPLASYTNKSGDELVRQIAGFQSLGMLRSAQRVIESALRTNKSLIADPAFQKVQMDVTESLLAVRVAGVFILGEFVVVVISMALRVLSGTTINTISLLTTAISLFILSLLASMFIRALAGVRNLGLVVAGFGFLFSAITLFSGKADMLLVVPSLALAGSLALLLIGKSSRIRTYAAVALYVVGYLGSSLSWWIQS